MRSEKDTVVPVIVKLVIKQGNIVIIMVNNILFFITLLIAGFKHLYFLLNEVPWY